MDIRSLIGKKMLYFDGGLGTLLQAQGLQPGEEPERWNIDHPDIIENVHFSYYQAGCHIVTTDSLNCHELNFPDEGTYSVENIAKAAVSNARRALAAKENSDLPVFVTMTYDASGRLMTGGDVPGEVALLEGLGVDAFGINCGLGPAQMKPIALQMLEYASLPMIVNPNAGLPSTVNGKTVYSVGPEEFAEVMKEMVEAGVWIAGGCCGTTPAHMSAMIARCKDIEHKPLTKKNRSLVCGTSKTVEIGPEPVIIGERINPTGKKKFKEALRNHDIEYMEYLVSTGKYPAQDNKGMGHSPMYTSLF